MDYLLVPCLLRVFSMNLVLKVAFFAVGFVDSIDELPPDVKVLVAAYSEWVDKASFVSTYTTSAALTMVDRDVAIPVPDLARLRPDAAGVLRKKGQFWYMTRVNDRPLQRVAALTETTPGALRNVNWERLCSDDFVVNYFPQDGLQQAGLTARMLDDGRQSSQFQSLCLMEPSFLNPFGGEVFDVNTGEWSLPGFKVSGVSGIKWSVLGKGSEAVRLIADGGLDSRTNERRVYEYTFLMTPNIPLLESIRFSVIDLDGKLVRYDDVFLSGFKEFECGVELPSHMECRSFPVSYMNSDGETKAAARLVVWTIEYPNEAPPSVNELSVKFSANTLFSGFNNDPITTSEWSLIGFDNVKMADKIIPPRKSFNWMLTANASCLLLAVCIWWFRKRRVMRRN